MGKEIVRASWTEAVTYLCAGRRADGSWDTALDIDEGEGGMKSESRVSGYYKPGSKDWKAEYDMLLDDGLMCNDCVHVKRCCLLFGQTPYVNEGKCQFYPNRFYPKNKEAV
jgi:hypothetical protein